MKAADVLLDRIQERREAVICSFPWWVSVLMAIYIFRMW